MNIPWCNPMELQWPTEVAELEREAGGVIGHGPHAYAWGGGPTCVRRCGLSSIMIRDMHRRVRLP